MSEEKKSLAKHVGAAIADLKEAYIEGLRDGKRQHAVGPEGLRYAGVVLSALGAQLIRDPELGRVVIGLPGEQFVDDQFAVASMQRFLGELKEVDPEMAEALRTGQPVEWHAPEDDPSIPEGRAIPGNPYAEDEFAGACQVEDTEDAEDMGEEIG